MVITKVASQKNKIIHYPGSQKRVKNRRKAQDIKWNNLHLSHQKTMIMIQTNLIVIVLQVHNEKDQKIDKKVDHEIKKVDIRKQKKMKEIEDNTEEIEIEKNQKAVKKKIVKIEADREKKTKIEEEEIEFMIN
jgi:hypothetical protein